MFHVGDVDGGDADKMRAFMGPQHIDNQIRQAIQFCWMVLPSDKKSVDEVEREIRRLVDRALQDLREDSAAFGIGTEPPSK